jgi:hypothetical protein
MAVLRVTCIVMFIVIVILFIVGFSALPYATLSSTINVPVPSVASVSYSETYYVDHLVANVNGIHATIKYSDIPQPNSLDILKIFMGVCIAATIVVSFGVVAGLFKPFMSKVLLFIGLLLVITSYILLQYFVSFQLLLGSVLNPASAYSTSSKGSGYALVLVSTILMFINLSVYAKFV